MDALKTIITNRGLTYDSNATFELCVQIFKESGIPAEQVVDHLEAALQLETKLTREKVMRAKQSIQARIKSGKGPELAASTPMKFDASSLHKAPGYAAPATGFSTKSTPSQPNLSGQKRPASAVSGGLTKTPTDVKHSRSADLSPVAMQPYEIEKTEYYEKRTNSGQVVDKFNEDLTSKHGQYEFVKDQAAVMPSWEDLKAAGVKITDVLRTALFKGYCRPPVGRSRETGDAPPLVIPSLDGAVKLWAIAAARSMLQSQLQAFKPVTFAPSAYTPAAAAPAPTSPGETSPSTTAERKEDAETMDAEVANKLATGLLAFDGTDVAPEHPEEADPIVDINLGATYRYMHTRYPLRKERLLDRLERMKHHMMAAYGLAVSPVGLVSQEPVVYVGRVCVISETGDGKLNKASVSLEGSEGTFARRAVVSLDLSGVNGASLFPGQIIGVRGMNASGKALVVQAIYHGCPPPPVAYPLTAAKTLSSTPSGPIKVWVANGPFTLPFDLNYRPLQDLFAEAGAESPENIPDVLILQGPFVDSEHPCAATGEVLAMGKDSVYLDTRDVWGEVMALITAKLAETPALRNLRVVLVSSFNDANAQPVIPTPPVEFDSPKIDFSQRIITISNPGIFTVGDAVIGCVSADVISQLNRDEMTFSKAGQPGAGPKLEKMYRLAQHLLEQRSFVPLFPTPATETDLGLPLELSQLEHVDMPVAPDLLIVPSKMKTFVKQFGHTIMVNPGTLLKKSIPGTFAKVHIYPPTEDLFIPVQDVAGTEEPHVYTNVPARTKAEVVRI